MISNFQLQGSPSYLKQGKINFSGQLKEAIRAQGKEEPKWPKIYKSSEDTKKPYNVSLEALKTHFNKTVTSFNEIKASVEDQLQNNKTVLEVINNGDHVGNLENLVSFALHREELQLGNTKLPRLDLGNEVMPILMEKILDGLNVPDKETTFEIKQDALSAAKEIFINGSDLQKETMKQGLIEHIEAIVRNTDDKKLLEEIYALDNIMRGEPEMTTEGARIKYIG